MIKINLLPPEAGKRQTAAGRSLKLPKAGLLPYVGGFILALGVAGYTAFSAYQNQKSAKEALAEAEKTKKNKQELIKRRQEAFDRTNQLTREIEQKFAVVQALGPENRVFWSEKLNMIALARLNLAVYVTKLTLDEQIGERETKESRERREEFQKRPKKPNEQPPKPVMEPIINQSLFVEAIAYAQDSSQRLNQINRFYDALKKLRWKRESGMGAGFLDKMLPEFEQLPHKITRVGGFTVLRFGFKIIAVPQQDKSSGVRNLAPGQVLAGQKATTGSATAAPAAQSQGGTQP
jgi:hypothetical protein